MTTTEIKQEHIDNIKKALIERILILFERMAERSDTFLNKNSDRGD